MENATDTVGTANQMVSFGEASKALKQGKRVARVGWNGKDIFIFMQVPCSVHKVNVPRMTSLPQSVKDEFQRRFDDPNEQIDEIYYLNQLAIVYPSNLIYGWVASPSDVLENDWIVLD